MEYPQQITLATYNIRLGLQQGLAAIAAVIQAQGVPDILAIQEVGRHWTMGPEGDTTRHLAESLNLKHHRFAAAIEEDRPDGGIAQYGHALLSRWPIIDSEIIDLPRNMDEPRTLLRSIVQYRDTALTILSTHLSHRESDRPQQGEFLASWLDTSRRASLHDGPRFLLGDLNSPPSEPWISGVLPRWEDADGELNRPTFPADHPRQRIDYLLAQGARCLDAEVVDEVDASDHRPLFTRWLLSPDEARPQADRAQG